MTGEQLEELQQLISAADSGEWNVFPPFGSGWSIASKTPHPYAPHADMPIVEAGVRDIDHANVKAIAALHNAFPAMAKALRDSRAELDKLRGDRSDVLAVLARVADALDISAEALIEDPSVAIRSARGSVRELREIAERNAANAQHLRATAIEAERERDEARAEAEELSQLVTTSDRQLGDEIIGLRRELSEALRRMKKAQNERDFANERLRRLKAETGWAKREYGCQCQWEEGDSACPVHGEEAK